MPQKWKNDEISEIENFILNSPKGHFMQSPRWARCKPNWESEILISRDSSGAIKGIMQVLLKKTPVLGYTFMYAPRGPVCDVHDRETLQDLMSQAKACAKHNRCYAFMLDPDVPISDTAFIKILCDMGFEQKADFAGFGSVQPHFVFRLPIRGKTEEEILSGFEKQTRKNVRRAMKFGVTCRIGGKDDLPSFYKLISQTGNRQSFQTREFSYFQIFYDSFFPEHLKLMLMEYEGELVAGALVVLYGDKVWSVYSGTADVHRDKKATFLMRYEMIRWGLAENCAVYDLMGVPGVVPEDDPLYGLYAVKKGFGGELIEFAGEFTCVYRPWIKKMVDRGLYVYRALKKIRRR